MNGDDQVRDPHNIIELAALQRMIQRSNGFRIAFAVASHPALQVRLADAVRRDLPDVTITEVTIEPGAVVAAIENAARSATGAVFLLGLDRLGSARARSAVIAELNLNRDHLWRTVGVPVVLWAADFAVREFAQHATGLWSGRSGVYRFRPEGDDSARTTADAAGGHQLVTDPGGAPRAGGIAARAPRGARRDQRRSRGPGGAAHRAR